MREAAERLNEWQHLSADKLNAAQRGHISKVEELNSRHAEELRRSDLILANERAQHTKELAAAEKGRLDAIGQVGATQVSATANQAKTALDALAATTASDRETLRSRVETAAADIVRQTSQTVNSIGDRIAGLERSVTDRVTALEKSNSERAGRQSVEDPQFQKLLASMDQLSTKFSDGAGQAKGVGQSWGVLLGVAALIGLLLSGYAAIKSSVQQPPVVYTQPQVGK